MQKKDQITVIEYYDEKKEFHGERLEKVRDYCFWKGITQNEFFTGLIDEFFKGKKVKPRPSVLKKKMKRKYQKRK